MVTLHRPSNVDDKATLSGLVASLVAVSRELPLVFAIHPRTRKRLEDFGLIDQIQNAPGIKVSEPLGYIEFMNLVSQSAAAITDSGGVQEETTYLGIPCLTLRENTERPITLTQGTNRLIQPDGLLSAVREVLGGRWPRADTPGEAGAEGSRWEAAWMLTARKQAVAMRPIPIRAAHRRAKVVPSFVATTSRRLRA
jgi:UDP-N-acetylglucosamine 2-epimerase (non-hydrolysing)